MAKNPFDFVNAISFTKEDMFAEGDITMSQYPRYIIDLAMSQYEDTVLIANEANRVLMEVPPKQHFQFYSYFVPKRKRFSRWGKMTTDSDVELLMEVFGYSRDKATEARSLLTEEQIEDLRSQMDIGGKSR